MAVVNLTSLSGVPLAFEDKVIGRGGMKEVYMSPDRGYVVGFFRDPVEAGGWERLQAIVGQYRDGIFGKSGDSYWNNLFCWPSDLAEYDGRLGVVVPTYRQQFFFEFGSVGNDRLGIKGREKEGKWFASASNRSKFLDPREKGTWFNHLRICLQISRAVRRLHAAGLAHSDLSYKNVLVDPTTGQACVIDIDGLIVPGKFPPDVIGTPDFIAPEVVATQGLDRHDPARVLPSTLTDRHALAVLIYMYLLYRHPLRGARVHDTDPMRDEALAMGANALFVEHPDDASNRVRLDNLRTADLPWGDPDRIPYTVTGPILSKLFERAFIQGLHDPQQRPTASEWENAIVRTIDLVQPCAGTGCEARWYVFDNTRKPSCPFCGTDYHEKLPVLNLYSKRTEDRFQLENHRVMVWDGQSLHAWHVNRLVFPNEHLPDEKRKRVGYFQRHQGDWVLVNESMPDLYDVGVKKTVPIGGVVRLIDGSQFVLSREDGGRLIQVQLVDGSRH